MPIMGVPFQPPAPYPLPADFVTHLRSQSEAEASPMICRLLIDHDCAELAFVERAEPDGLLRIVAAAGRGGPAEAAARALMADSAASAYFPNEPDQGQTMSAKALQTGSALLVMGDCTPTSPELPQAPLRDFLLAGQAMANVGFTYANPISGPDGQALGVLTLVRGLSSGPLNHDQPALVHALALLLGETLSAAPVI